MGLSSIGPTFDPEERAAQGLPFRRGMCSIETLQDEFYWEGGFPPLLIDPIDFNSLYQDQLRRAQSEG